MDLLTDDILEQLRHIELQARWLTEGSLSGLYQSVLKGTGSDYHESREYVPGDDVRYIDWNLTARMPHPHVKVFREEKDLTLYVLLDMSPSMFNQRLAAAKRQRALELAACLGYLTMRGQDRFGIIGFDQKVQWMSRAKKGRTAYLESLQRMMLWQGNSSSRLSSDDTAVGTLQNALQVLSQLERRRCLVFVISDFLLPSSDLDSLHQLFMAYDAALFQIVDPVEEELRQLKNVRAWDLETGKKITRHRRNASLSLDQNEVSYHFNLQTHHAYSFQRFLTTSSAQQDLVEFFQMRQRHLSQIGWSGRGLMR